MIKFFRIIRQKLVNENRVGKYLLYAVGEIVLVIIGILIALNLNKVSEAKVQEKKIEAILRQIQDELTTTVEESVGIIDFLRNKDSLTYVFMMNDISKEVLKDPLNRGLWYISNGHPEFIIPDDGFKNLMLKSEVLPERYNNIASGLKDFYLTNKSSYEQYKDDLKEIQDRTNLYLQDNYAWFAESVFKPSELNDEEIEYLLHNKHYKNSVAQYSLYAMNLFYYAIQIRIDAIDYIREIDDLLNETISRSFDFDVSEYADWIGRYHSQGDTMQIVQNGAGLRRIDKRTEHPIYPLNKDKFHYLTPFFMVFQKDEKGEIEGYTVSQRNFRRYWEKIK
jgi:hypothetical protein